MNYFIRDNLIRIIIVGILIISIPVVVKLVQQQQILKSQAEEETQYACQDNAGLCNNTGIFCSDNNRCIFKSAGVCADPNTDQGRDKDTYGCIYAFEDITDDPASRNQCTALGCGGTYPAEQDGTPQQPSTPEQPGAQQPPAAPAAPAAPPQGGNAGVSTGTTANNTSGSGSCRTDSGVPVSGNSNPGLIWKADCNNSCTQNSGCPQSTDGYVLSKHRADTTNWCFGFDGGVNRCMQIAVKNPRGGKIECDGNPSCVYDSSNAGNVALKASWQGLKECWDLGGAGTTCNYVGMDLCLKVNNTTHAYLCEGEKPLCVEGGEWKLVASGGNDPVTGNKLFPDGFLGRLPPTGGLGTWIKPGLDYEFALFEDNYTAPKQHCDSPSDTNCLDYQYIKKGCKGLRIATTKVRTTSAVTSSPSPSPSQLPSPSPSPSPAVTTVSFRVAENPANLAGAAWQSYTAEPMNVNFEFSDKTPGQKTIFAEFKDSNNRVERRSAQIKLLGPDPTLTGCLLSFEGNNTVLNLTGQNFGSDKGTVKSNETSLQVREWKAGSIKAVWQNAPEGAVLPVTLTNPEGQTAEGQCSAISQLALGAKVFCRAPSQHNTDNVDLTLAGAFEGGTKVKQKVTIDKDGIIQGLTQKLEAGKNYLLSLKAPKSVRRTVPFTPSGGTTNIPNFVLPVGDIFPADGGDGTINALDKAELNRQWIIAADAANRSADFNKDSRVNSIDWACMRYDFGKSDDAEPSPGPTASPVPSASPSPSPSPSVSPSPGPGASASITLNEVRLAKSLKL